MGKAESHCHIAKGCFRHGKIVSKYTLLHKNFSVNGHTPKLVVVSSLLPIELNIN